MYRSGILVRIPQYFFSNILAHVLDWKKHMLETFGTGYLKNWWSNFRNWCGNSRFQFKGFFFGSDVQVGLRENKIYIPNIYTWWVANIPGIICIVSLISLSV